MSETISSEKIKELREKTGAGMLSCKNALVETNGNFEKAVDFLREKGLSSAQKKLSRTTKQGVISNYIHTGSKLGVILELNCETDFVARRIEFSELARALAIQATSNSSIQYISLKDIPKNLWEAEIEKESNRKLPKDDEFSIKERAEANLKELTLLDQKAIREPDSTVEEYIKKYVALLGENIQVSRLCKFSIGQETIVLQAVNKDKND